MTSITAAAHTILPVKEPNPTGLPCAAIPISTRDSHVTAGAPRTKLPYSCHIYFPLGCLLLNFPLKKTGGVFVGNPTKIGYSNA